METQGKGSVRANKSTPTASDILTLTDDQIASFVQSLPLAELKLLAPLLRLMFAGLMAYDEQKNKTE